MLAAYSTSNLPLEGVVSTKRPWRKEDGEAYKNMLTVDSRIDTQSKTYKRLKDAGLLDLDGNGTIDPRFKVDAKDSRYINVSWERDLDKWAKNGNLIVPIQPKDDTSGVLDKIGYTEKGKPVDKKGWFTNNIRTTREERRDGVVVGESMSTEKHFDALGMWQDTAYQGELDGVAAGILSLPLDQQLKYIGSTLGWGNKITKETWANIPKNSSEGVTGQIDFLKLQAYEQHMDDITGDSGKRKATANDVIEYERAYPDRDPLIKDKSMVYFKKEGRDQFKASAATKVDTESAEDRFDTIVNDPTDAMEVAGISGDYNSETGIISYEEEVDTLEDYITTKGKKAQRKVTTMEPASLNLNKKKDLQKYVNIIVKNSRDLKGAKNDKKVQAIKNMVKKHVDQKSYRDLMTPPSKKPVYNPSTGEFN
jgi:hypothetical protein